MSSQVCCNHMIRLGERWENFIPIGRATAKAMQQNDRFLTAATLFLISYLDFIF
jgi:hypothetical protein